MNKTDLFRNVIRAFVGLSICGLGTYMMIQASIGITPWETLQLGTSGTFDITYGAACVIVSLFVLLFDILMGEKIGVGTVLDAFWTGNAVTILQYFDPIPKAESLVYAIPLLVAGMATVAFGQYFYIKAGLSCGPRDAFLVGVGKLLHKLPIGAVNAVILTIVFAAGYFMGGPVGIGTVIGTFGFGPVQQLIFNAFHFDPRTVEQKGICLIKRRSQDQKNSGKDQSC